MLTLNGTYSESRTMDEQWFFTINGEQHGPVSLDRLRQLAVEGQIKRDEYVWREGMTDWAHAHTIPEIYEKPASQRVPPLPRDPSRPSDQDIFARRIAAGVCGILVGCFGVHKFVIGRRKEGIIMLMLTVFSFFILFMPMQIIGMIEGIIYLAKSDDEFYQDYIIEQRGWF